MGTVKVTFVQDAINKASERKWTTWLAYLFMSFSLIAAYQAQSYVMKNVIKRPDYIEKSVPIFFLLIAIEAVVDYYSGKKFYRLNDSINSIFQGVFSVFSGYFIRWLRAVPYAYVHETYAIHSLDYSWFSWLVAFLAIDFGYYWFHRFGHEINLFWASHIPHHSSQEYNLTTALRQGAYQTYFSWMFYVPMALFVPVDHFYVCEAVTTLYQFWIHTKYIKKFPWIIEYIFNTPSHHRVHHARNYKYLDKNYAGTLIIWDRMFGSFEPEQEEVIYGVTHDLNTWNPFYIQFYHLYETWISSQFVSGVYNKFRVFIDFGPAFNGEVLYPEESANPPVVSAETVSKYDHDMPNLVMTLYGLVHSTLLIGSTLVLGKAVAANPFSVLGITYTATVVFGLFVVSALYDGREWAKYAECARMIVLPFALSGLNASVILSALALVSICVITLSYKPNKIKQT